MAPGGWPHKGAKANRGAHFFSPKLNSCLQMQKPNEGEELLPKMKQMFARDFSHNPCEAGGLGSLVLCTQCPLMKNHQIYVHCSWMLITQRCLFRLCLTPVHWHFMRGSEPYFDAVKWLRPAPAGERMGDLGIGTAACGLKNWQSCLYTGFGTALSHCTVVSQIRCWWNGLFLYYTLAGGDLLLL